MRTCFLAWTAATSAILSAAPIPASVQSDAVALPPRNPYLMDGSIYPVVHFDPGATDASPFPNWGGVIAITPENVQRIPHSPHNIGCAHYPYPDGDEVMFSSGINFVSKIRITGDAFERITTLRIPEIDLADATDNEIDQMIEVILDAGGSEDRFIPQLREFLSRQGINAESLVNGMYTCLDMDGNYYGGWGTTVYKVGDKIPGKSDSDLQILKAVDLRDHLPSVIAQEINRLLALGMTYDGHIAVGLPGLIAIMDRDLENVRYIHLEGEAVDNGFSIDEHGGIYVVTSRYMRKLVWNGETLSDDEEDGAWKVEYESIPNQRSLSRGSGNTPTLMGFGEGADRLVFISDAGNPIHIMAFWRDEIPEDFERIEGTTSRRVAAKVPIRFNPPATIEWSPHVYGNGVLMMASSWTDPVLEDGKFDLFSTLFTAGVSRDAPRGAEKWSWNRETRTLESDWVLEDIPLQWGLYPVSTASNTVTLAKLDEGVYSLESYDWDTGEKRGSITLGKSPIFNVVGGLYLPMANGDIYVHGAFGPLRISRPAAK